MISKNDIHYKLVSVQNVDHVMVENMPKTIFMLYNFRHS